MNKDKVEGSIKNVVGKTQQKIGEVVGSEEQQVKGLEKQIDGKVQKKVGDVKDFVKKH